MPYEATSHGHRELVQWLCGEGGFVMHDGLMDCAAQSGNLELVQWLRGEGCDLDYKTSSYAVALGRVEVLRWLRENGCPWTDFTRDRAKDLGYADDFGNLHLL